MLSFDIARCPGAYEEGWREGCSDCLRRTAPGDPFQQVWIKPPTILVFECHNRIAPGEVK